MTEITKPNRRGFLLGLAAGIFAPAIVPYADLMPVKKVLWTPAKADLEAYNGMGYASSVPTARAFFVEAIEPVTGRVIQSFHSPTDDWALNNETMHKVVQRNIERLASLGLSQAEAMERAGKLGWTSEFFVKVSGVPRLGDQALTEFSKIGWNPLDHRREPIA